MTDSELRANIKERMELVLHGAELSGIMPWLSDRIHALALEGRDRTQLAIAAARREIAAPEIPEPFRDAFPPEPSA